jgi:hypothetical protein
MCSAGYRAYGVEHRRCTGFLDGTSRQRSGGGRPLDLGDGSGRGTPRKNPYLFDGEQVTTDV